MTVCLLILNYNGREHLESCLPSALEAARVYNAGAPPRGGARVIVLDNRSTEPDVEFLKGRFPDIEVLSSAKNDLLFSYNQAVLKLSEDIVVTLNNDMRFESGFLGPLLEPFVDPAVFAVTAQVRDWQGQRITTGKRVGYFRHAWFYKKWDLQAQRTCQTLDANGGVAAFRRDRFIELGGFDRLFHPGYCEDTDLSYRAWQRGWKTLYQPRSVVYHKIGASFTKALGDQGRTRLIGRNEVLFMIKNCGGGGFLLMHLLLLPLRALRSLIFNRPLAYGILMALPRIPAALLKRFQQAPGRRVPERQFLEWIRSDA